jgi:hypothetical protein
MRLFGMSLKIRYLPLVKRDWTFGKCKSASYTLDARPVFKEAVEEVGIRL